MQHALRPYATAGIAVIGAGAMAMTPVVVAPTLPDIQMPAIQLTAGLGDVGDLLGALGFGLLNNSISDLANPFEVYPELVTNSFSNVAQIGATWLDRPFPIAQAVASNQIGNLTEGFANPESLLGVPAEMFGNVQSVFGDLTTLAPDVTISSPLFEGVKEVITAFEGLGGFGFFNAAAWQGLADAFGGLHGSDLLDVFVKLPPAIVMGLASVGPVATTMAAFDLSSSAIQESLASGEYLPALGALVSAPGFIGNGLLNGQWGVNLLGSDLPLLNGLLVPQDSFDLALGDLSGIGLGNILDLKLGPFTGLTDGFVNYLPGVVGDSLGGGSLFGTGGALGDLFGGLDLTSLLGGLDLNSLAGLLPGATDMPVDLAAALLAGLLAF